MADDVPQKTVNFQILSENHLKLHVNVRPQIHKLDCQIKGEYHFRPGRPADGGGGPSAWIVVSLFVTKIYTSPSNITRRLFGIG